MLWILDDSAFESRGRTENRIERPVMGRRRYERIQRRTDDGRHRDIGQRITRPGPSHRSRVGRLPRSLHAERA